MVTEFVPLEKMLVPARLRSCVRTGSLAEVKPEVKHAERLALQCQAWHSTFSVRPPPKTCTEVLKPTFEFGTGMKTSTLLPQTFQACVALRGLAAVRSGAALQSEPAISLSDRRAMPFTPASSPTERAHQFGPRGRGHRPARRTIALD